jgi:hypothetical protein
MPDIDPCVLHVPHKEWANNEQERQNYLEIERWSIRLKECGSTCTCAVLEWDHTQAIPDSTATQIAIPGASTLCGSVVDSHMFIVTFNIKWDGNTNGMRHFDVEGNGESSSIAGMDAPGLNYFGSQTMNLTKMFPSHLNTMSPKYIVNVYQNSGGPLTVQARGQEFYPCCDCDWSYGC